MLLMTAADNDNDVKTNEDYRNNIDYVVKE